MGPRHFCRSSHHCRRSQLPDVLADDRVGEERRNLAGDDGRL
jgi:hypothetical protein